MNYDDIINLPHHVSKNHMQMSLHDRTAQFAPFSALTGYEEVINETARLTDELTDMDEYIKSEIDMKLQLLREKLKNRQSVNVYIRYFKPDDRKAGGKYLEYRGNVQKIDEDNGCIIMENKTSIEISKIVDISINEKIVTFD